MRLNQHTAISTPKVLLVPYSKHHVPTYHEWMQDEELREATASEPLSLEEEYAMQQSWRSDKDKLTFIVCLSAQPSEPSRTIKPGEADAPGRMIGDVNLFLTDDDEDTTTTNEADSPHYVIGELEIMIARRDLLRHGYGLASLQAFITYIKENLDAILHDYAGGKEAMLSYLRVKVGGDNFGSIALFEKLGFRKMSDEPNVFGELELRRNVEHIGDDCAGYRLLRYEDEPLTNGA